MSYWYFVRYCYADTNELVCIKRQELTILPLFYFMSTHHVHLPLFCFFSGDIIPKFIDYDHIKFSNSICLYYADRFISFICAANSFFARKVFSSTNCTAGQISWTIFIHRFINFDITLTFRLIFLLSIRNIYINIFDDFLFIVP